MTCLRCYSLLREDTEFTVQMVVYGYPQRRYVCPMGHSFYRGMAEADLRVRVAPPTPAAALVDRVCSWCGDGFLGPVRQRYCSRPCVRAMDADRARKKHRRTASTLSPDALRALRAMPRAFGRPATVPIPYADRARSLTRNWV